MSPRVRCGLRLGALTRTCQACGGGSRWLLGTFVLHSFDFSALGVGPDIRFVKEPAVGDLTRGAEGAAQSEATHGVPRQAKQGGSLW